MSSYLGYAQSILVEKWWAEVRGDKGLRASLAAIGYGVAYFAAVILGILLLIWLYRKIKRLSIWQRLWDRFFKKRHASIIEFYDRMLRILSDKGLTRETHQTPLEFAFASGRPEVVSITEKYNRVRFGEKNLSTDEANAIEAWLLRLETDDKPQLVPDA